MNENIIKPNLNTDTNSHYSLLAVPSKFKPKEKIIDIKQSIDIDNNSILSDFNSEKKVQSVNSSRKSSKVLSISSNKNKFSQPAQQSIYGIILGFIFIFFYNVYNNINKTHDNIKYYYKYDNCLKNIY
jgi:hypothetical protein